DRNRSACPAPVRWGRPCLAVRRARPRLPGRALGAQRSAGRARHRGRGEQVPSRAPLHRGRGTPAAHVPEPAARPPRHGDAPRRGVRAGRGGAHRLLGREPPMPTLQTLRRHHAGALRARAPRVRRGRGRHGL
ncbi:MAG: hypothetical protein AVDCRST_MAG68-4297, partial [uncultured Gemmatimonadetes bacterium]